MNGVLATILAILIYPGILAALAATWVLAWVRDAARAAVAGAAPASPLADVAGLRAALGRASDAPAAEAAPGVALAAILGVAAPLAALVLLPVPGNPIARPLGLTGDLAVEGALLLGLPLARLLAGWAMPSSVARLAADRGARLVAGYALPMILALMALSQQVVSLNLTVADAHSTTPLSFFALLARVLAAAAFACCLPALAHATVLRTAPGSDGADGELAGLGGFDLAVFRVAEGLQLVAAAALFVAAFILPLAVTAAPGLRAALWPVVMLLTAAGIGGWEALRAPRAKQGEQAAQAAQSDKPPLSWWFGFPLLLALFALVLAAWAARGA
jgi:formate hydrogenlyase subunit 4